MTRFKQGIPAGAKKISAGNRQLSLLPIISDVMNDSPSHLKHCLALLFALIPLAAVVGACVACP